MTVNGWMGLAFDLRRDHEVERDGEDGGERSQLRRAARIARRTGPQTCAGAAGDLRRTAIEAQQAILRHALRTGDLELVRRAGRTLRVSDFAGEPGAVEGLLGVLRDARSAESDVLEAAAEIAALLPAAAAD